MDLESPDFLSIFKLTTSEGYICENCNGRIPFFVTTQSLWDAMHRVEKIDPSKQSFRFHFLKTLKKAIGVQEKYHGQSQHTD